MAIAQKNILRFFLHNKEIEKNLVKVRNENNLNIILFISGGGTHYQSAYSNSWKLS